MVYREIRCLSLPVPGLPVPYADFQTGVIVNELELDACARSSAFRARAHVVKPD